MTLSGYSSKVLLNYLRTPTVLVLKISGKAPNYTDL